jgi:co-chaperonin GroES (HSP10)
MTLKVRPIGDKVLVEPLEEKGKQGTIIIPDTAKEKPMAGLVVAVGTGKTGDDGKKAPIEVNTGDQRIRRPGQGWCGGPEEGHARGPAECWFHRRVTADARVPGHRDSGGGKIRFSSWRPGRHGLLSPFGLPGGTVK